MMTPDQITKTLEAELVPTRPLGETLAAAAPTPAPPPPTKAETIRDYGPDDMSRMITLTTGAIEEVCETTITKMYDSVTSAEGVTKHMRERADFLAERMRAVSKDFAHDMGEHLLGCQQAMNSFEEHAKTFADKLARLHYPRGDK